MAEKKPSLSDVAYIGGGLAVMLGLVIGWAWLSNRPSGQTIVIPGSEPVPTVSPHAGTLYASVPAESPSAVMLADDELLIGYVYARIVTEASGGELKTRVDLRIESPDGPPPGPGPGPDPPPPPPPAPTGPLFISVWTDPNNEIAAVEQLLATKALREQLEALGHQFRVYPITGDMDDKNNLGPAIQQAGGPPAVVVQVGEKQPESGRVVDAFPVPETVAAFVDRIRSGR